MCCGTVYLGRVHYNILEEILRKVMGRFSIHVDLCIQDIVHKNETM